MYSRHVGSVAAHRRCAATFASDRPPCRLSARKFFLDDISSFKEITLQPKRDLKTLNLQKTKPRIAGLCKEQSA
jgi:hypothetical protein